MLSPRLVYQRPLVMQQKETIVLINLATFLEPLYFKINRWLINILVFIGGPFRSEIHQSCLRRITLRGKSFIKIERTARSSIS